MTKKNSGTLSSCRGRFSRWLLTGVYTIVTMTVGATIEAYGSYIQKNVGPFFASGWNLLQDHISPLSMDKQIGVSLRFYIPPSVDKAREFESKSVTLPAELCHKSESRPIVSNFDGGERDSYTNVIVRVSCRPSGRTKVVLAPQSGDVITLYDDIFKDGTRVEFPGVPGSYNAGVLSLYILGDEPHGPLFPINKCMETNDCEEMIKEIHSSGT